MSRKKKVPLRKCIGCGQMKPKKELLRVVCVNEQEQDYRLDANGKQNGRGAYVCREKSCWEKAQKSHALERSFGHAVPASVREMVTRELEKEGSSKTGGSARAAGKGEGRNETG